MGGWHELHGKPDQDPGLPDGLLPMNRCLIVFPIVQTNPEFHTVGKGRGNGVILW